MKKYVVGRVVFNEFYNHKIEEDDNGTGNITDILGVFSDKEKAESVCRTNRHFVIELEEDKDYGDVLETAPTDICWYPLSNINLKGE